MNIGRVLGNIATLVTLLVVWMLVMVVLAQKNRIDGAESTAAALKDDVAALHSSRRPEDSALQAPAPVPVPAPDPAPDAETILSLREDVTDLRETVAGYENALRGVPFPIVVDVQDMLDGFRRLLALADQPSLVVPGHDPLVTELFPRDGPAYAFRLDRGPTGRFPF